MTGAAMRCALTASRERAQLVASTARAALTASRERAQLVASDLRALPWLGYWLDTQPTMDLSPTVWAEGAGLGGRDLGAADTRGEVWLSSILSGLADRGAGSSFDLSWAFVQAGPDVLTQQTTVRSSEFVLEHAQLLTLTGAPLVDLVVTRVDPYQLTLAMPSRGSVGIPAGGWAVVWLRALPILSDASAALTAATEFWGPNPNQQGIAALAVLQAAADAEAAWNVSAKPTDFFRLVNAPST